jgi:uncharacterized repeat protein (TIGR03843 family)
MDTSQITTALQEGELEVQGQFLHGSNYTFLGRITLGDESFQAVYKPRRGEQPLWDFPEGTLAKREVAAYVLSQGLGWELVPPTVYRHKGPLGPGSLQYYVEHRPSYHYFNFSPADLQRLRPVVVFDIIANNADRKGSHVIMDLAGHLWLIDQGLCFNVDDKLRTVIWDFAGEQLPDDLRVALVGLGDKLAAGEPLYQGLLPLLRQGEIRAIARRAVALAENGRFPKPPDDRRPYPYPPI